MSYIHAITFNPPTQLPDADADVLASVLRDDGSIEVWEAHYDGECWRTSNATTITDQVVSWAHKPAGVDLRGIAAQQEQPAAAEVSEERIDAIWRASLAVPGSPYQSVIRFARAILALRPQAESEAPTVEAAREMGARGGPVVESERLAFEAWMAGHCWVVSPTWNGETYDDSEGDKARKLLDPLARMTRMLWAAWRDRAALSSLRPQAVPMTWPKARDVGRFGDMDPMDHMRVGLDSDNDVYVSVWSKDGGASVEFCNPGGGGGGSSRRTREALIALMVAMEADNADRPDKDWWARRNGITAAQAKGTDHEGGAA